MSHARDEGFVWLDDPPRSPARPTPSTFTATPGPSLGRLRPLDPWHQTVPSSWRGRILSVARSALFGRRALLAACVDLTEALTAELRHALRA